MAELLAWFGVTHELVATGFGAYWRLAWLPGDGAIGAQDARRLEGLAVVRQSAQEVLGEEMTCQRDQIHLATWRNRVRRERA